MALNEEEQMDVVFKSQRSQEVDPVSGNEVPPGSLPEEVRDDIPAMLSEGEYVVPADVLRYYGVKFFEDLRTEAKMGLSDMEANGRIGGEPIAAQGSQDADALTPEEMAVLQEMGMAVGGLVPQPTQSNTPNLQQQQMYPQAAPVAMGNVGYNEGGLQDSPATAFDTSQYGRGFLIDQARGVTPGFSTTPKLEVVTMYGPNGEIEAVTLPTQQNRYDELVALGYSRDQVAVTTETDVGREEPEGRDRGLDDSDSTPTESVSVGAMSDDQLASSARAIGIIGTIGKVALGPVASNALGTATAARYNDILDEMNSRGLDTTGMSRKGSIFGGEESLLSGLSDTNDDGTVDFGDTFLGDLLGFDGKAGVQGKGLKDSWSGGRRGGAPMDATNNANASKGAEVGATFGEGDLAGYSDSSGIAGGEDFGGNADGEGFGDGIGIGGLYKSGGLVKKSKPKKKK